MSNEQSDKPRYVKNFDLYWRDLIIDKDGNINLDQLMRELSDYSLLMEMISQVYNEFTPYSKPFTRTEVIIDHIEQVIEGKISRLSTRLIGEKDNYHI